MISFTKIKYGCTPKLWVLQSAVEAHSEIATMHVSQNPYEILQPGISLGETRGGLNAYGQKYCRFNDRLIAYMFRGT